MKTTTRRTMVNAFGLETEASLEGAEQKKVRIVWNGQGGELDSVTVKARYDDDDAVRKAFEKMLKGAIVNPGDSFIVEEVA